MADTATPQAAANPFSASTNSSPLSSAKSSPVGAAQKPPSPLQPPQATGKPEAPLGGLAPRPPVASVAPAAPPVRTQPSPVPTTTAPSPMSPAAPQTTVNRPTTTVRPKMRPDWEVAKLQNAEAWNKGRKQLPGDYAPQAEHLYANADQLRGLASGQLQLQSDAEIQEFVRQHPDVQAVYNGLDIPDGPDRVHQAITETAKQKLQHIDQASAAWRAAHEAEPGTDGALRVHGRQDLRDLSAKPIPFSEQAELAPARLPGLKDYAEAHGVQVEDPEFERYWAAKGPVGSQGGFSQDNPYSRIREYRSMQKSRMKDTRSTMDEDAFLQSAVMKATPSRLNGESAQTAMEMGKSKDDAMLEYQIENAGLLAQPGEGTGDYMQNLANMFTTGEGFKNYARTGINSALALPDAGFGLASVVPSAAYDMVAGAAGYKTDATQRAARDIVSPFTAITGSRIGEAGLSQTISDYGGNVADDAAKSNNLFYRYGGGLAGRALQVAPAVIGTAALGPLAGGGASSLWKGPAASMAGAQALPAISAPVQQVMDDTGVGEHQRRWSSQLSNYANDPASSGYVRPFAAAGAAAIDSAPALLTGGGIAGGAKMMAGGAKHIPFASTAAKANLQGAFNTTGQVGKNIASSMAWPVGISGASGAIDSLTGQGQAPAHALEGAIEQYANSDVPEDGTVPPVAAYSGPMAAPANTQPSIPPASDTEEPVSASPGQSVASGAAAPGQGQPGSTQPDAQGIIADGLTSADLKQLLANPSLRNQVMQGGPGMHKMLLSQLDNMATSAGRATTVSADLRRAKSLIGVPLLNVTEDYVLKELNKGLAGLTGNAPGASLTIPELRLLLNAVN